MLQAKLSYAFQFFIRRRCSVHLKAENFTDLDCGSPDSSGNRVDQHAGVFRRTLDPRVGAWEFIRTALSYTLTLPLGIPLYEEADYVPRAIDCLLHCLLKTDV